MKHTGENYQPSRDVKDVAADIRAELKRRGVKANVRIERFSMGCSVHVVVKPERYMGWDEHKVIQDLKSIQDFIDSFRRVDSDLMSDYYSTNFYDHLNIGDKRGRIEFHNLGVYHRRGELGSVLDDIFGLKLHATNVTAVNFGGAK